MKGPTVASSFKKRPEVNMAVKDSRGINTLFRGSGLTRLFGKEKLRANCMIKGVTLSLDTVPLLGRFLEIEGPEAAIVRSMRMLGLSKKEAIRYSYDELFSALCRAHAPLMRRCGEVPSLSFAFERRLRSAQPLAQADEPGRTSVQARTGPLR